MRLSVPFLFRSRCRYCSSLPTYYCFLIDKLTFKDFKISIAHNYEVLQELPFVAGTYGIGTQKYYRPASYIVPNSISSVPWKGNKEADLIERSITDAMLCSCGKSVWLFKGISTPDVMNRKSRTESPIRVIVY